MHPALQELSPTPSGRIGGIRGGVELMSALFYALCIFCIICLLFSVRIRGVLRHSFPFPSPPPHPPSKACPLILSCMTVFSWYYFVFCIYRVHRLVTRDSLHPHHPPPPPTHGPAPVPCAPMIGTGATTDQSGTWGRGDRVGRRDRSILLRAVVKAGKAFFSRAGPLLVRQQV